LIVRKTHYRRSSTPLTTAVAHTCAAHTAHAAPLWELLIAALPRAVVAGVCLKKIRAHPRQHDMFMAAFRLIDRLDIDMASVELADVVALAQDTGLTVYDAWYVWLARLLESELVTLDKKLATVSSR
jgi:predicted nucleic acid-binding protein